MSHDQQDFAGQLRQKGYRLTTQRQIVLDALCALGRHATASDVYEQLQATHPGVDRATVYRSLHLFQELGLVVTAGNNHQTVFEIAAPHPHHHLVCKQCGTELSLDGRHFDTLAQQLLAEYGFAADLRHLTLTGICQQCL